MNLLDRAKLLLQSRSSAEAAEQTYHVSCPLGHRLSGSRTESYQALRCSTCGESVFVLPRSPLPLPPAPARDDHPARRASATSGEDDEPIALTDAPSPKPPAPGRPVEEIEIDWSEPEPTGSRPTGVVREPARPRPPAGSSREHRRAARPSPPAPVAEPWRERAGAWVRRRRNPLIFLGVLLVVAGSIALVIRRHRLEDYPRVAEIGRTEGLAALDDGRFDSAQVLLSRARRAVEALGGRCEGAAEILQGAQEAEVFSSLIGDPLETMIEEADPAEDSSWPARFQKLYRGRSVIIDAHVQALKDESGATRYDLDYRIFPNGEGSKPNLRVGRLDVARFPLFQDAGLVDGSHVLFGAKLASFRFDTSSNEWLVGLEPDSGVFLTHPRAVRALWPVDDPEPTEKQP